MSFFEWIFSPAQSFLTKYAQLSAFSINSESCFMKLHLRHALNNSMQDYGPLVKVCAQIEIAAKNQQLLLQIFRILLNKEMAETEVHLLQQNARYGLGNIDYGLIKLLSAQLNEGAEDAAQGAQLAPAPGLNWSSHEPLANTRQLLEAAVEIGQAYAGRGKELPAEQIRNDCHRLLLLYMSPADYAQASLLQQSEKQQQALRRNLFIYTFVAQRLVKHPGLQGQIMDNVLQLTTTPSLKALLQNNQEMTAEQVMGFRFQLLASFTSQLASARKSLSPPPSHALLVRAAHRLAAFSFKYARIFLLALLRPLLQAAGHRILLAELKDAD